MAPTVADVPGRLWKIWLLSEQNGEAGGVYLFKDEKSLAAYLSGPIIRRTKTLPQSLEIRAKSFETMPEETAVTRGPIPALATT